MKMESSKLIESLRTKEDISTLESELNSIIDSFYKKEGDIDEVLRTQVRYWVGEIILQETQKDGLLDYSKKLLEMLRDIESVQLILAFEPTRVGVERIYEAIQPAISRKIVLDISCDPQIIGGVIISFNGLYKDYSFRRIFEAELNATREEIVRKLDSLG
jgi:F0F1-type ATP synthase delta subunit